MASDMPKKPLRGILKKPSAQPALTSASAPSRKPDNDAAETAVRHATIIQDRKDHEAAILDAVVRLAALPTARAAPYSASQPSPADAAEFRALVRAFQPTEYDDLVEERNTLGACGYALCAAPRRRFGGAGAWKLVNAGRADFAIARRADLEQWCSDACARRALYVKVQLLETAAWERVGIPDIVIDLLDEAGAPAAGGETSAEALLAREVAKLRLEEDRRLAKGDAALALERGDGGAATGRRRAREDLLDIDITERRTVVAPQPPDAAPAEASHRAVEGHTPKFGGKEA